MSKPTHQPISENHDPSTLTVKIHLMKDIRDTHKWMFIDIQDIDSESFDPSRYKLSGELTVPLDQLLEEYDLDTADLTELPGQGYNEVLEALLNWTWINAQNIDSAWNPIKPCRSAMIGDVIEYCDNHYVILSRRIVALGRVR